MHRFFDRVVAVSAGAIGVSDGVTSRTGDPSMRGGIVDVVVIGVVKLSREEWHRVVAAGAPAQCLGMAVPVHQHFSRGADAGQIGRIIE